MISERNLDGKGMIFGRIASFAAKRALLGETINIYNCEEIIITGRKQRLLEDYPKKSNFTGHMGKGPYRPRRADLLLKRRIRGMVPYENTRGREAFARIKFWIGMPEGQTKLEKIEHADMKRLTTRKYLPIKELSRLLGGKI